MSKIIFHSKIVKLDCRQQLVSIEIIDRDKPTTPNNMTCQYKNLGWFVALEGSRESIYIGEQKPEDWEIGDTIKITMEKI